MFLSVNSARERPFYPGVGERHLARTWGISIRYDSDHRCLLVALQGCTLATAHDVETFYAQLRARTRTFSLPSDLIVDYSGLRITGAAIPAFLAARNSWILHFGGRMYRFDRAAALSPFTRAPLSTLPGSEPAMLGSYEEALEQLAADRARDADRTSTPKMSIPGAPLSESKLRRI